jgi:hypothetical protein
METWLIFATLGAIGVTALLTAVLWRINLAAQSAPRGDGGTGTDDGGD